MLSTTGQTIDLIWYIFVGKSCIYLLYIDITSVRYDKNYKSPNYAVNDGTKTESVTCFLWPSSWGNETNAHNFPIWNISLLLSKTYVYIRIGVNKRIWIHWRIVHRRHLSYGKCGFITTLCHGNFPHYLTFYEWSPLATCGFPSQRQIVQESRVLLWAWMNCWTNNPVTGNLRGHDAHIKCSSDKMALQFMSWWRHDMGTVSALLTLCDGKHRLPVDSPHKMLNFHVLFVVGPLPGPRLNIKTVLSTYGDFHVKDKTAVRTSYL